MNYPLIKALNEAGVINVEGKLENVQLAEGGIDTVFVPTLEGLVESCGDEFTEIRDLQNLQKKAVHKMEIPPEKRYEAVSTNGKKLRYGHGHTMYEAMANLKLSLINPTFGL